MAGVIARPPVIIRPRGGLLRAEHFQVAYATNDLARAKEVTGRRYGVTDYAGMDADMPAGGHIRIELAWVGGVMIELIQASGPGSALYNDILPPGEFAMRHHHFGYLLDDLAAWEGLMQEVQEEGWSIDYERHREGFLRFCYVKAPDLGHYLEYFLLEPAGAAFFESVPAN